MDKKTQNLLNNFLSLGILQIFSYIVPLITLPYLSRILGVEKFGIVFFAYAFTQYFNMLIDFGFDLSATREVALHRYNKKSISNIFNSVIVIKILFVFISLLILFLLVNFVPIINKYRILFFFSFLTCVGNAIYPVWFFQGIEAMKNITHLNVLSRTIFLIFIFIFIKQQDNYIYVPLIESMGWIVAGIIGFVFGIKKYNIKLYIPKIKSIKKRFFSSAEIFISRFFVALYTNTNTVCLGFISSAYMTSLYVAADKIYQAINGLKQPLINALYPYVAKNKDIKLYRQILKYTLIITIIFSCIIFIFAKNIISVFYGMHMVEAYKILRIFCILIIINIPSGLLGYPLLYALGKTKQANNSIIYSSLFHVVCLIILLYSGKLTIYSMAILVLITTTFELLFRIFYTIKYKLLKINKDIMND